jgi:hypothetical protein
MSTAYILLQIADKAGTLVQAADASNSIISILAAAALLASSVVHFWLHAVWYADAAAAITIGLLAAGQGAAALVRARAPRTAGTAAEVLPV